MGLRPPTMQARSYPRAKANCSLLTGYIILPLAWGKEARRWFKESRG